MLGKPFRGGFSVALLKLPVFYKNAIGLEVLIKYRIFSRQLPKGKVI